MLKNRVLHSAVIALTLTIAQAPQVVADPEIEAAAQGFVENHVSEWLDNPLIVRAITAQNEQNAALTQGDIDAMDQQWRRESVNGSGEMVDAMMSRELSAFLQGVREDSQGLITEIFIMDNKGLNVGQSDLTSDLWQGDEAKWQKTYSAGPNVVFVDDVELDESSQRYQTQVSYSITNPENGKVIGAVTIGLDAEGLLML